MSTKNNQENKILSKISTFGERLRNFRNNKKLSQNDLAAKLGFTKHTSISSFENDKTYPSFQTLQKMAEVLEVDLHWLITGKTVDMAVREKILNTTIPLLLSYLQSCQEQLGQIDQEIHEAKKRISDKHGDIKENLSLIKNLNTEKSIIYRDIKVMLNKFPPLKIALNKAGEKPKPKNSSQPLENV